MGYSESFCNLRRGAMCHKCGNNVQWNYHVMKHNMPHSVTEQQCSRTPWHEVTTPWRRAENWWRGDATVCAQFEQCEHWAVCVSTEQKPDFRRLEQVLPLCGIVWPLPGSQGIKSSLQSPNLDFLLFRCVIFQLRNNGFRVSFGEILLS